MANMRAKVLFDRALAHFNKNDYDKAVDCFKEALLEDPNYPECLYNLSCCHAVMGNKEDALVYLDRAIKLDVNCMDWAKEDIEFHGLRGDAGFKKVLDRNDPVKKPSVSEHGATDGDYSFDEDDEYDDFIDGEGAFGGYHPDATKLPPCPKCGAIVLDEDVWIINPMLAMVMALIGVVVSLVYFQSLLGIGVGLPLTAVGLFLYWKKNRTWVCQNCGAKGAAAGMPADGGGASGSAAQKGSKSDDHVEMFDLDDAEGGDMGGDYDTAMEIADEAIANGETADEEIAEYEQV